MKQSTNKQTFNEVLQKENHYKEEKYKDVKASKENLFFEEQNCDEKVVTRLKGREKIYKLKKKNQSWQGRDNKGMKRAWLDCTRQDK